MADDATFLQKAWNFIYRHALWAILLLFAIYSMAFQQELVKTLYVILSFEALALGLSGLAQFVFTKIDFTADDSDNTKNLGYIFLAVHILVGLVAMGTYIAQFGSSINPGVTP